MMRFPFEGVFLTVWCKTKIRRARPTELNCLLSLLKRRAEA